MAIMLTVARLMESPLIFNPNQSQKDPFLFSLSEPLLTQGLDEPHPSPATFNKTVGSVCVDKKGLLQAYWSLPPLLSAWVVTGLWMGSDSLWIAQLAELKVVLPVNASSSCWIPCIMCPMHRTHNTHCKMHSTEYAQQNHFSYEQPVKIGRVSLL